MRTAAITTRKIIGRLFIGTPYSDGLGWRRRAAMLRNIIVESFHASRIEQNAGDNQCESS